MALVLGTNCGFVTTAPTVNPMGSNASINKKGSVTKDTSPATAAKITEIGWYRGLNTSAVNCDIGLYAANGAVVPGEAGTRLYVTTVSKPTGIGYIGFTVDWDIDPNTDYWIGLQVDGTTTQYTDIASSGGAGRDQKIATYSLPNPFGGGAIADADGMYAIYAVWEAASTGTNCKINIGDTFKDVSEMKINIGDSWKAVTEVKQNVGDAWKTVF